MTKADLFDCLYLIGATVCLAIAGAVVGIGVGV